MPQFPFGFFKSNGTFLLPVGPFAGLTPPNVNSLSTVSASADYKVIGSLANPLKLKSISFTNASQMLPNTGIDSSIFLWADIVDMSLHSNPINAGGQNGGDASDDTCCCTIISISGGGGGYGGSGGGGGAASQFTTKGGGAGGSGGNGVNGQDEGGISGGGPGGFGFGSLVGSSFTFGNGGNGNAGGAGGNGFGGGGVGGSVQPDTPNVGAGGGGGGGGGLACIVVRKFSPSNVLAVGGVRGNPFSTGSSNVSPATAGGGGVIWIAAQAKLTAGGTWSVLGGPGAAAGTIKLFEIKKDLSLVQHTTLTDTWDNT